MSRPQWIPTLLLAIDNRWNNTGINVTEWNVAGMQDWIGNQKYLRRSHKYNLSTIIRTEVVWDKEDEAYLHILRNNSDNPLITLRLEEE